MYRHEPEGYFRKSSKEEVCAQIIDCSARDEIKEINFERGSEGTERIPEKRIYQQEGCTVQHLTEVKLSLQQEGHDDRNG